MAVAKTSKGYKSTKTGQYYSSQSAAIKADKASSSSGSSTTSVPKTTSGSTVSQQDYYLKPNESITEYNARIAGLRGDTPAELASMNQAVQTYATANPTSALASRINAPASPAEITKLDPVVAPKVDPTVVNPAGAVAVSDGMKTYMEAIQKQLEQQQARTDKLAKENQTLSEKYLGTMKNPEDVYNQAWEDTGMSAKEYFATQESGIKQIESLNNEYAMVKGAMEQQIAQSNDKMASMNFINNQTAQIRRNAEPQLNTLSAQISSKAATLQALQGNFAEARSLVNDAVEAATAGNKFKYDMYSAFYEQNVDNFNRVEKNYSEAFQNAMNIALKDYEMQREEKMQIGELMLKYPSAGIDMNGTLDEAFQRAGVAAGSTSGFSQKEISRAMQVLNGQSSMSDFTTAEQAKIRDTIWSLDAGTAGYTGQYPMSYAPGALDAEFNAKKMSVAGPGAGQSVKPVGELTPAQQSEGLNKLYSMGATPQDIQKFETDREFQAWVLSQE